MADAGRPESGVRERRPRNSVPEHAALAGSCPLDVFASSPRVKPGALGDFGIRPNAPVEHGAISREELRGRDLASAKLLERPVRRRNDASRKALLLVSPKRGESSLLKHLQQLDLHRYRDLADLVKKQRPVRAAALEHSRVVVDRAGEGALAVAEELRLDQRLGELR